VGLEAGPLSQWLHDGLAAAGHEVVLLETRHVKAALSAMTVKTDRKDARGIAQLLRLGWYRPVHRKSVPGQEVRALLVGRKLLQGKLLDIEGAIRGILRGFWTEGRGERPSPGMLRGFASWWQVTLCSSGWPNRCCGRAMRCARSSPMLHRQLLAIVRDDITCRRLMTAPGVGVVVAATFTSAVDDPGRFAKSRSVGAHFGLTPRRYQSGERDVTGGISRVGDAMARTALYEAAQSLLTRTVRFSALKRWGDGGGQAARHAAGKSRAGSQAGHRAASHVGGRHRVPVGQGACHRGCVSSEGDEIGAGAVGARSSEVPSPGRGNGEALMGGVAPSSDGDPLTRSACRPS
jgi:transposase